jgi:hypothetical protein
VYLQPATKLKHVSKHKKVEYTWKTTSWKLKKESTLGVAGICSSGRDPELPGSSDVIVVSITVKSVAESLGSIFVVDRSESADPRKGWAPSTVYYVSIKHEANMSLRSRRPEELSRGILATNGQRKLKEGSGSSEIQLEVSGLKLIPT